MKGTPPITLVFGDFLPWDSSPFFTTILGKYVFPTTKQSQIQVTQQKQWLLLLLGTFLTPVPFRWTWKYITLKPWIVAGHSGCQILVLISFRHLAAEGFFFFWIDWIPSLEWWEWIYLTEFNRFFTRWWQLKYFLFSPLPGEMIQFD